MYLKLVTFLCILTATNAALLLWSNKKLHISALTEFNDDNLQDLIEKLGHPEITIYKSSSFVIPELKNLLSEYHTAYSPNGVVNTENATDILGPDDLVHSQPPAGANTLSVLVVPNARVKRELQTTNSSDVKGPVVYSGKSNEKTSVLLYSPQPLMLRTAAANFSNLELGPATLVTVNTASKDQTTKLRVKVRVGEDNNDLVMLQFSFAWSRTYWSLKGVNISRLFANYSVSLNIVSPFSVPAHFSYLCGGVTRFTDAAKTAELQIYDIQVQIDAKNGVFGDGYDCVDFTTVPIWSGLFVSGLLGVGLIIALVAIGDIKTMDKFDNQKTKQIAITVTD